MNWLAAERWLNAESARPFCEHLSHAELCTRALQLAADWQARDVRRIALSLEDIGELAIALLAAWRAGAEVILPADDSASTRERLRHAADVWLEALPSGQATPLPAAALDPDTCRLTLWTSGSSGAPKAIVKTLRQLESEARALESLWGAQLGDASIIASVSARHIYGLLFRLIWPLCGGRLTLARACPFPETLQQASLAHAAFAWVASPALLARMGDALDWAALRGVRQVFSSGGALSRDAAQALHAHLGQYPTEIYGSSETGGIAWRQGGDLWHPFSGITLTQASDGALRVASPYLPAGQIESTADAVELLPDGRFLLRGRLDRIVKLEEKRIALPALEQALHLHPWVDEARMGVVRSARAFLGALIAPSRAGLHALRNQGRRALTDTLRQHLTAHCEAIALPRRWRLLERLPYNAQGKLVQHEVETLLAAPRPLNADILDAVNMGDEWHLYLVVPLDLAYFSGHFPRVPVLPGVTQISWAQQLARAYIPELPTQFIAMEALKFQHLIRPGDRLTLTLRFDTEKRKLHFAFKNGDVACSSGRMLSDTGGQPRATDFGTRP